jgi:NTE family protein
MTGANLSAEDHEGLSSLHITVAYKQNGLLKYLLDQNLVPMNIEQTTQKTGLRPLHIAIESNNLEAIELLLQYGVNIEALTSQGKSPLHLAIEKDNVEAVVTLLEKSADPLKPYNGKKPMEMALEAQKQNIVTALRQNDQRKLYPGHTTLKNSNSPRPERNDKPAAIKNLVLQGGSVKSIAYVGALKALEKHGVSFVKDIVRVGGTSAGSIFAMLIGLGYTWEELLQTLKELNFESLLDGKLKNKLLKMKDKKQNNMRVFINILNGTFGEIFKELQSKFGIFEGDHLYKFLLEKIEAKVKLYSDIPASEITFADLQAIRNKHPKSYFKDIFVIGTNLSLRRTEIFSPLHTPNMILADAVRISSSIPFVFVPHRKYIKKDGKRIPDPAGHLYVDGGVLDNYPIWLFDQARFLDPYRTDSTAPVVNHETLGLRLVSGNKKTNYEKLLGRGQQVVSDDKSDKDVTVDSLMKFIVNFAGCYNKQQENTHLINNHDMSRTVYIYHMDVSLISFNLGDAQKTALMLSGEVATDDYMRNRTAKKKMHVRLSRLALLHDEISITASDNMLDDISLELTRLKNISPVNLYKYFIGATPDEIEFLRYDFARTKISLLICILGPFLYGAHVTLKAIQHYT